MFSLNNTSVAVSDNTFQVYRPILSPTRAKISIIMFFAVSIGIYYGLNYVIEKLEDSMTPCTPNQCKPGCRAHYQLGPGSFGKKWIPPKGLSEMNKCKSKLVRELLRLAAIQVADRKAKAMRN
ncbi:uncharacterized protein [Apostichopus japonicus]|uniref:uncharacterized protein n=1 Tax=Stichopus japonicus TaxID=307972 RepID=UPI003AB62E32